MTARAKMLSNTWYENNSLLSVFVIKHDDAFVFPLFSARLKFSLFRHILVVFCVFHVVHVNPPDAAPASVVVRRLYMAE